MSSIKELKEQALELFAKLDIHGKGRHEGNDLTFVFENFEGMGITKGINDTFDIVYDEKLTTGLTGGEVLDKLQTISSY